MTWVLAIVLALAAFAVAAFVLRAPRQGWTTLAAALALGLAGYALQASPGVPGAPSAPPGLDAVSAGFSYVDERKEVVGSDIRSANDKVLISDGLARKGRYADAAALLRGAVRDDPSDGEAWLALGNALVEHAGGVLTQPALLAYRRAADLEPGGVGPGYFLGLALIRQGRLMEARGVWQSTLQAASEDATGRETLELRIERLDELLERMAGPVAPPGEAGE